MSYKKEEMIYYDYYWGMAYEATDPHISGEFDDTVLRRTAGKEMLYFVNRYSYILQFGVRSRECFRKLERIIRDEVPQNMKTQKEVKQWMDDHIDSFQINTELEEVEQ